VSRLGHREKPALREALWATQVLPMIRHRGLVQITASATIDPGTVGAYKRRRRVAVTGLEESSFNNNMQNNMQNSSMHQQNRNNFGQNMQGLQNPHQNQSGQNPNRFANNNMQPPNLNQKPPLSGLENAALFFQPVPNFLQEPFIRVPVKDIVHRFRRISRLADAGLEIVYRAAGEGSSGNLLNYVKFQNIVESHL
jgi:hypothetical protein